jgi:putative copper export protein
MVDGVDLIALVGVGLKLTSYLTSLLAAGFALVVVGGVVPERTTRAWLILACWLSLSAAIIALLRVCLSTLQMGDLTMWSIVWDMQHRAVLAVFAGGTAIGIALVVGLGARGVLQKGFALLGALLISASFSVTGHSQALEDPSFFPYIVVGHVVLVSFWLTAPFVLWPHNKLADADILARTERYGAIAVIGVPLLFISGGVLAWKLGGGLSGLTTSTYGITLGAKLAASTGALGLGAVNKLRVASILKNQPDHGKLELKRTLSADMILFTLALVAITLATTLFGPPHSMAPRNM